jgi:hypothetical protein
MFLSPPISCDVTWRTHGDSAEHVLRAHRRYRNRDDDDAAAGRASRVARDGESEAAEGRGPDGTAKLRDIASDPHVNLAYYKDRTREWISVSGVATISRERETIRELYAADWKAWFPNEGDPRHGTPDDPRMVLIGVDIHAAVFLEVNKPRPVVLYEVAKGWLTGTEPEIGEMHTLDEAQFAPKR